MPGGGSAVTGGSAAGGFLGAAGGPIGSIVGSAIGGALAGMAPSGGDRSNLERHAIARRVRDAKEAGIHPLFALGASVGYSPSFSTGSAVGDALRYGGKALADVTRENRAKETVGLHDPLYLANVRAANASASRDEAQAVYTLSQNAREATAARSRGLDAAIAADPSAFGSQSLWTPVASEVMSARPGEASIQAGPNQPGMIELNYGTHGRSMSIPRQDVADSDISGAVLLAADKLDRAGLLDSWLVRYYKGMYGGVAATGSWLSSRIRDFKNQLRLARKGSANLRARK